MESYSNFPADTHLRTPKSKFWSPNHSNFIEKSGPPDPPEALFDFLETIPANLNFAAAHIFSFYPKKLSYSSRNAYIKKIRARRLGEASCLIENFKNAENTKTNDFVW